MNPNVNINSSLMPTGLSAMDTPAISANALAMLLRQAAQNTSSVARDQYNAQLKPMLSNPMYGISQVGVQSFLPVQQRRPLSQKEQMDIDYATTYRWWPRLTSNFGSSPTDLMANPGKKGVLSGLISTTVMSGVGYILGRVFASDTTMIIGSAAEKEAFEAARALKRSKGGKIGLFIGIGLGILSGIGAGLAQAKKNGTISSLMTRFPEGSDVRDIMSDTALQSAMNRAAMQRRH